MSFRFTCFLGFYCFGFIIGINGQPLPSDSGACNTGLQTAISAYEHFLGAQSRLYNGIQYIPFQLPATGHPFFIQDQLSQGSVRYDGADFNQVPMEYDLMRDVLVIGSYDSTSLIVLRTELVGWFRLLGHTFIHIPSDSSRGLETGFYDQLYEGKHEVLARRVKDVQTNYSSGTIVRGFELKVHYYILSGDRYVEVSGKGSVLRLFKDKKSDLRAFIRKSHIRFKKDPDSAIARMAAYYDQISL